MSENPFYTDDTLEARHAAYQALAALARHVPADQQADAERRTEKFARVFDGLIEQNKALQRRIVELEDQLRAAQRQR